jgi:hypothetical protein
MERGSADPLFRVCGFSVLVAHRDLHAASALSAAFSTAGEICRPGRD